MGGAALRVVIQARLSSTRLPAKSLLPVAGIPLAALAALRAANAGAEVVVAVPEGDDDELLVAELAARDIAVARGPLDDVLARYVAATADLADDAVVVRLTADNCFPDGDFVAGMAASLAAGEADYCGWGWPESGLPYGMAAEAFRAGLLRAADREATSAYDREHVTPWMKRVHPGSHYVPEGWTEKLAHLRCTVDGQADYRRVARVFSAVADPVGVGWRELARILAAQTYATPQVPSRIAVGRPRSEMVLGTVQLGMEYGRANEAGMPTAQQAARLLAAAARSGVDTFDTARAYGASELRVGDSLAAGLAGSVAVVTKLDPLALLADDASDAEVVSAVDASVFRSCRDLRVRALDTLLLHRWSHRRSHGGRIWQRLVALRSDGVIGGLGASVQSPAEALEALADADVTHIQLPLNVLDRRWAEAGVPRAAEARPDVVVHARSVYLQGLLVSGAERWPKVPGVDAPAILATLDALATQLRREDRADLCLAFVRSLPWVHALVIGVETVAQLEANVTLFGLPPLTDEERETVLDRLPVVPDALVDPSNWS